MHEKGDLVATSHAFHPKKRDRTTSFSVLGLQSRIPKAVVGSVSELLRVVGRNWPNWHRGRREREEGRGKRREKEEERKKRKKRKRKEENISSCSGFSLLVFSSSSFWNNNKK